MSRYGLIALLFCWQFGMGCLQRSTPTRTFVLSKISLPAVECTFPVHIGRVMLPDYLKRWELVTLQNEREVRINDFAQWGELLEDSVRRTLNENFRQVLGADFVLPGTPENNGKSWRLDYEFLSLTGNEEGVFRVKVRCLAAAGRQKKFFNIAFELPYAADKPEKLVAAHEEALGRLVQETLMQLPPPPGEADPGRIQEL